VTLLKGPTAAVPFMPELGLVASWEPYVNADQAIGQRCVNIVTSEGCLRRCTYCSEPTTSGHAWLAYDTDACAAVAGKVTSAVLQRLTERYGQPVRQERFGCRGDGRRTHGYPSRTAAAAGRG
jgi:hypothetical protein